MNNDTRELSPADKRAMLIKLLQEKKAKGEVSYPQSFGQRSLWFIQQMHPDSSAFNESFAWRIKAQVTDEQGLEIAKLFSERHAILRTTYDVVQGKPIAVVHPSIEQDFVSADARNWSEEQLRCIMQDDANKPINLQNGPVLRIRIYRCKNELIWMTTVHHIAIDMISMSILMEDIKTIFACRMAGQSPPPLTSASYEEFAKWQVEFTASAEGIEQREFWLKSVANTPSLNLPTDFPAKRNQASPGALVNFKIHQNKTRQLEQLAREHKVTLFALLLTAFQVLVGRYSAQEKFLIGSIASARTQAKFQKTIGFFANLIAVPTDQSDNPTFAQYLQRTRQFLMGALANQDYPYALLVEHISRQHEISNSQFVNVTFMLQNHDRPGNEDSDRFADSHEHGRGMQSNVGGAGIEVMTVFQNHAKSDLRLDVFQSAGELLCLMHYDASLFEEKTVAILAESFEALIDSILAEPNELISQLNMLGPSSTEVIYNQDTRFARDHSKTFLQAWSEFSHSIPSHVAIEEGDRHWTYGELQSYVDWISSLFPNEPPDSNEVVAIFAPRSAMTVAAMLACWQTGRISLFLDPQYPDKRLGFMVADARPRWMLTTRDHSEKAARVTSMLEDASRKANLIQIDQPPIDVQNPPKQASSIAPLRVTLPPLADDRAAYLIYTSGSTGNPKGVLIPHRGLNYIWLAMSHIIGVQPTDRVFQTASFGFDISVSDILQALGNGVTLIMPDMQPMLLGEELLQALRVSNATIATLTPSVLATVPKRSLPNLRCLIAGAEECSRELVSSWSTDRAFFNAYGPTEASVLATIHRCFPDVRKPPIGYPLPNTQVYILDRLLQPQPLGAFGEICIGGDGVGIGYWNQVEMTRQRFVSAPSTLGSSSRLYRTGDIGRWRADGSIEFHGRRDQQIKLRGLRIELEEIEHVMRQCASFHQVALAGGKEFQDQIVAFVVEDATGPIDREAVLEKMRQYLPPYMIPRAIVVVADIPRSASGKVDRASLVQLWTQTGESQSSSSHRSDYVAPRDELEQKVASIFSEVLKVEQVGVHDDFFELGGHSLLAAELASKLRPLASAPVPLHLILVSPTVAGVANVLAGRSSDTDPSSELDLNRESLLDLTIRPTGTPPTAPDRPTILLTGATGFLGAHLLSELLANTAGPIYCLVRASSHEEGLNRIIAKCRQLGIKDIDVNRIFPEPGDLAAPRLGLNEERFNQLASTIDVIYHNGALVNFSLPYRQLRAANVLGTETALRLACLNKSKPFHYVSTISVFPAIALNGDTTYRESDPVDDYQSLFDGYSQSKWVAEKLVLEAGRRGLPYTIFRPGRITGDSRTGIGEAEDLLWSVVRQCIQVGVVPALEADIDMTPVDYVSQAMIQLSLHPTAWNKVYHLRNPQPMGWPKIVERLRERGHQLESLDMKSWKQRMESQSSDPKFVSLLGILPEEMIPSELVLQMPRTIYDARNTIQNLAGSKVACPPADDRLLSLYLDNMHLGTSTRKP